MSYELLKAAVCCSILCCSAGAMDNPKPKLATSIFRFFFPKEKEFKCSSMDRPVIDRPSVEDLDAFIRKLDSYTEKNIVVLKEYLIPLKNVNEMTNKEFDKYLKAHE